MRFRKLRITWSVAWGVIVVLLIVMWVRSYWYVDSVLIPRAPVRPVWVESFKGRFLVTTRDLSGAASWQHISQRKDDDFYNSMSWSYMAFSDPIAHGTVVPFWPGALAAITATTIPWIHRSKRFSLRTLLIATTLIALALGLIVSSVR